MNLNYNIILKDGFKKSKYSHLMLKCKKNILVNILNYNRRAYFILLLKINIMLLQKMKKNLSTNILNFGKILK